MVPIHADRRTIALGPILLGLSSSPTKDEHDEKTEHKLDEREDTTSKSWQSLPPHRDETQVQLDVDRSFIYYPNSQCYEVGAQRPRKLADDLRNSQTRPTPS